MRERNEKREYENYVENSFQKIDKNRQNFKEKYLHLQPHEKYKIKTQPDTLEK